MNVTRIALILTAVLPLALSAASDPRMTPDERAKALKWLEESRQEFLAAIDGVNEQQWRW